MVQVMYHRVGGGRVRGRFRDKLPVQQTGGAVLVVPLLAVPAGGYLVLERFLKITQVK